MKPAIEAAAALLNVEPAALAALIAVESSGTGILAGRAVIRLEVHHLWKHATDKAAVDARFRVLPQTDGSNKPWLGHEFLYYTGVTGGSREWRPMHTGQALEWVAFVCAQSIDADAAVRSTSWGAGQVLGDYERLGYGAGADGRSAFLLAQQTEAGQIDTMRRFIAADPVLVGALRGKDWITCAGRYNGRGQMVEYAARLAKAYAAAGK
jgi:hypothetical protein